MRSRYFLILFFVLIIAGAILNPFGLIQPVKDIVYRVFSPFTSATQKVGRGANNTLGTLVSLKDVIKENERLRIDNLELKAQNIRFKETERENKLLKKELEYKKGQNTSLIAAKIIAKSPTGFMDTVIIDQGIKSGLKIDQPVVSNSFLIGRIRKVTAHTSEILLITSNQSKIPALLQDSRGDGIVQGGLRGLRIEDIPLDTNIKQKEAVITSNLGGIFPAGIPIGYIKQVVSSESDIAQSATITSPVDFSHLEMVLVIQ